MHPWEWQENYLRNIIRFCLLKSTLTKEHAALVDFIGTMDYHYIELYFYALVNLKQYFQFATENSPT